VFGGSGRGRVAQHLDLTSQTAFHWSKELVRDTQVYGIGWWQSFQGMLEAFYDCWHSL